MPVNDLPTHLLGSSASSKDALSYIEELSSLVASEGPPPKPEVKSYSDAVYMNYYSLGLSLLYVPTRGYRPKSGVKASELDKERLILDGIDFYNVPESKDTGAGSAARKAELAFANHPATPLVLQLKHVASEQNGDSKEGASSKFEIRYETTGRQFVECLGEPNRKGGGAGPSSGSINIWCEWSMQGIMVEFAGDAARGPQAWERGRDAVWKVLSIFPAKDPS